MIRIFLINLRRDIVKYRHMEALFSLNGLTFVRVDAVDGNRVEKDKLERYVSQSQAEEIFGRALVPGEIGCALSHISVYEKILEAGDELAVILEDDVVFDASFKSCLEKIDRLPADWEVVLLGHGAIESVFVEAPASFWRRKDFWGGRKCVRFSEFPFGTYGYLINQNGAKKLLEATRSIVKPIDHYTGDETIVNVYGVSPVCIRLDSKLGEQSNIEHQRQLAEAEFAKHEHRLIRLLRLLPFSVPLSKKLLRFFRCCKLPRSYAEGMDG